MFEPTEGEPSPTATDLGDGTVLVVFPLGQMAADAGEMRSDPQMVAMMRPMLDGHIFTIHVAETEVVSTTGTLGEDGTSAFFSFPLVDILDPAVQVLETFETIIRY